MLAIPDHAQAPDASPAVRTFNLLWVFVDPSQDVATRSAARRAFVGCLCPAVDGR
jgi:hypothetical protein